METIYQREIEAIAAELDAMPRTDRAERHLALKRELTTANRSIEILQREIQLNGLQELQRRICQLEHGRDQIEGELEDLRHRVTALAAAAGEPPQAHGAGNPALTQAAGPAATSRDPQHKRAPARQLPLWANLPAQRVHVQGPEPVHPPAPQPPARDPRTPPPGAGPPKPPGSNPRPAPGSRRRPARNPKPPARREADHAGSHSAPASRGGDSRRGQPCP